MLKISLLADPAEKKAEKQRKNQVEVEVVRTKITLAWRPKNIVDSAKLILYTKKPSKECELWEKLQALRRLRRRAFSRV